MPVITAGVCGPGRSIVHPFTLASPAPYHAFVIWPRISRKLPDSLVLCIAETKNADIFKAYGGRNTHRSLGNATFCYLH